MIHDMITTNTHLDTFQSAIAECDSCGDEVDLIYGDICTECMMFLCDECMMLHTHEEE